MVQNSRSPFYNHHMILIQVRREINDKTIKVLLKIPIPFLAFPQLLALFFFFLIGFLLGFYFILFS